MITEDQLEQLAIQWFQDTGGVNIEHRTPNIERRSEEKRNLAEAVRRLNPKLPEAAVEEVVHVVTKPEHPKGRPFRAWNRVGDGTQGVALGCRMLPRWSVCNSQGFLVSQNQIKRKLNP